jgi:hypothetical protein
MKRRTLLGAIAASSAAAAMGEEQAPQQAKRAPQKAKPTKITLIQQVFEGKVVWAKT